MNTSAPRIPFSPSPSITTPRSDLSNAKSEGDLRSKASQQQLSAALQDLCLPTSAELLHPTSPCFLHRRFDDAVNIEKVLEEIAGDEGMSHSRLVQTANGVREVAKQLQRKPIKRAVRNVMIVTRARANNLVTLTRELTDWLLSTPRYGKNVGVNVYVDDKLRNSKRFNATDLIAQNSSFQAMLGFWTPETCRNSPQKFDLVLTLGGDGTVLFTSWLFQRIVPPVLSFSLGSLGFLTPFDFASYHEQLNRVMGGTINSIPPSPIPFPRPSNSSSATGESGMRINLRMRFTCTVYRANRTPSNFTSQSVSSTTATTPSSGFPHLPPPAQGNPSEQFEVLNELVIDRGPSPYVSLLHLYGDGHPLTTIQADGLILSTPTGSTAYSLSAGGSLVHPDIPAILLTPICPHTLSFRPMLLNDTIMLTVKVPGSSRANAWCSFDGKGRVELRQGDSVEVKASKYPFPTVAGGTGEWIDSISRTLRWNTREVNQKSWRGRNAGIQGVLDSKSHNWGAEEELEHIEGDDEAYDIDFGEDDEGIGTDQEHTGDKPKTRVVNGAETSAEGRESVISSQQ